MTNNIELMATKHATEATNIPKECIGLWIPIGSEKDEINDILDELGLND